MVNESIAVETLAGDLVKGVFELNILTSDYLRYRERRTGRQWWSRYESNARLLIEATALFAAGNQFDTDKLRKDHLRLGENFHRLMQTPSWQRGGDAVSQELEYMLEGRIAVAAQEMVSRSLALSKSSITVSGHFTA